MQSPLAPYYLINFFSTIWAFPNIKIHRSSQNGVCLSNDFTLGTKLISAEPFIDVWKQEKSLRLNPENVADEVSIRSPIH